MIISHDDDNDGFDTENIKLTHKKEDVVEEKEESGPSSAGEKNGQQNSRDDTSEEDFYLFTFCRIFHNFQMLNC